MPIDTTHMNLPVCEGCGSQPTVDLTTYSSKDVQPALVYVAWCACPSASPHQKNRIGYGTSIVGAVDAWRSVPK